MDWGKFMVFVPFVPCFCCAAILMFGGLAVITVFEGGDNDGIMIYGGVVPLLIGLVCLGSFIVCPICIHELVWKRCVKQYNVDNHV